MALKNHRVPLDNPYGVRYDLNASGFCDIGDLVALDSYWSGTDKNSCIGGPL